MKLTYVVGIALLLAGGIAAFFSLKSQMTPYISFRQARETQSTVQVHGTMAPASARYDGKELVFRLKDTQSTEEMDVVYTDVKPGNFDQARDVVAIGTYKDGVFHAEKLLVKCPSKYQEMEKQQGKPSAQTAT
jgi:cytochrome c-type biogenesis protein CcmE